MSIEKIKEFMAWARINVIKHNFYLEVKVQGNIQVMKVCKASSYGLVIHPCAKWYVYTSSPPRICKNRWIDADSTMVMQPCTKYGKSMAKNNEVTVWTQIHVKKLIILTLRSLVTFI